jgi:hypothetical protein
MESTARIDVRPAKRSAGLRIRTLMTAVAITGAFFGGAVWGVRMERLGIDYRNRSADHAKREAQYQATVVQRQRKIETTERLLARLVGVIDGARAEAWRQNREAELQQWKDMKAAHNTLANYHGRLRRKYERAARYPWLPIAPDPPEPK